MENFEYVPVSAPESRVGTSKSVSIAGEEHIRVVVRLVTPLFEQPSTLICKFISLLLVMEIKIFLCFIATDIKRSYVSLECDPSIQGSLQMKSKGAD
jgi:hypothetical protein